MSLLDKFKKFLRGWEKQGTHQPLNTYWRRFKYFPLNWMWTLGSLLFIALFIKSAIVYESPLLWTATLWPLLAMIYNFVDEYYEFKWTMTGHRKLSAKTLIGYWRWSSTAVLVYVIIRVFITG